MKMHININADSTNSLVQGIANNSSTTLPSFYLGDYLRIETIFTDGLGNLAEWYGHPDVYITIGLGDVSTRTLYTKLDTNSTTDNGYVGYLNLANSNLVGVLEAESTASIWLEVQGSFYGNYTETYLQIPIDINNQIISGNRFPIPPSQIQAA